MSKAMLPWEPEIYQVGIIPPQYSAKATHQNFFIFLSGELDVHILPAHYGLSLWGEWLSYFQTRDNLYY